MSSRRVVITGMGVVSPVGNSLEQSWSNLVAGSSGIGPITRFDASAFRSRIAGEVREFDIGMYLPAKDARRMSVFIHYGIAAGVQAWRDSQLSIEQENAERIGVLIGSGIGGLPEIEDSYNGFLAGGARKISPFFVPGTIINMISGNFAIMHGLKGPNIALVSACTTGLHSIGMSMRMIQYGDADIMVCGSSEGCVSPLALGGFASAQALSLRNDEPTLASRPWDKDRDGFVLGEGAGVMVIEEYEHAQARGAKIYAELVGFGMSCDAFHMTAPDTDGPRRCMINAMSDAKIAPDQLQYINAHGTSTPLGDKNETAAIRLALGTAANKVIISSTKSMTGHLLGGAGGVESVFTVLAIHHGIIPPTINLQNPDEGCDLDFCPNIARKCNIEYALKNNFGFGGTNGSLIFRKIT